MATETVKLDESQAARDATALAASKRNYPKSPALWPSDHVVDVDAAARTQAMARYPQSPEIWPGGSQK